MQNDPNGATGEAAPDPRRVFADLEGSFMDAQDAAKLVFYLVTQDMSQIEEDANGQHYRVPKDVGDLIHFAVRASERFASAAYSEWAEAQTASFEAIFGRRVR